MKYSNLFALGLLAFLLAVPQGAGAVPFVSDLEDQTFQVGVAVSVTLPQIAPGQQGNSGPCTHFNTNYSISPTLPPGLSFAGGLGTAGVLSGTPTQITATTEYTYTGQDDACYGTFTETFNITVSAAASGGVTINPTSLEVDEDSWGYYTISLDSAPSANVTIKLSISGDRDIFALPMKNPFSRSLTFTPSDWQAKRVRVWAVPDPDALDGSATITHTASSSDSNYDNITIADVSVTEDDDNRSVDGDCGWGYACKADETPVSASPVPAESTCSRQPTQGLQYDCETLSGLYDKTGGSEWEQSGNWLTESSLEGWYGVSVSGGRVSELDLSGNRLSGEISDLSALGGLETLDLSGNEELEGELPLGLMNLPGLDTVDVRCTDVTAPDDAGFEQWLDGIDFGDAEDCASTAVPETEPQDDVSAPEKDEGASRGGCAVSGKAGTGAGTAFGLLLAASVLLAVSRGGRSRSGPRRFIESG